MDRRKAIGRIILTGIAGGGLLAGYKWYDWTKTPDIRFLQRHKDTLAALAETIIPASPDSPGARQAGVQDFIITMIRDCTDTFSANKFIDGLKDLDHYCHHHFDKAFEACSAGQQVTVLKYFEEKGRATSGLLGKAESRWLGNSFLTTLKAYTVQGYCTSQAGAEKGLAYAPIPGSYHGCIPKLPGQKAWATK
jgi:hypothetical protein